MVLIIFLLKVSTETLANTSPTGGSCGSDLNGPAVMDACQKVMARLEPYRTPQRQLFFTLTDYTGSLAPADFSAVIFTCAHFQKMA